MCNKIIVLVDPNFFTEYFTSVGSFFHPSATWLMHIMYM